MLTDRDIVRGQLRLSADLHCLKVGDVMTANPLVIEENTDLAEAITALNTRKVRRAPVVDDNGRLTGIVTLDDLLPAVASELGSLAALISMQASSEADRQRGASVHADAARS
jgi:predicted transcriptional regulator